MAKAARKKSKNGSKAPVEFRSEALAQALERQDMAAIALALKHGNTVVPLTAPGNRDSPLEVGRGVDLPRPEHAGSRAAAVQLGRQQARRTCRRPSACRVPDWLRAFLTRYVDEITTVFFDIAGPHPMQASPADLLAAARRSSAPPDAGCRSGRRQKRRRV